MANESQTATRVYSALEKLDKGYSNEYDSLLAALLNKNISDEDLAGYLRAFNACITDISRRVETLVGVILHIDWTLRDPQTVTIYQSFLTNLVSAHTYYLKAVVRMIVQNFHPVINCQIKGEELIITEKIMLENSMSFLNLHTLLRAIVKIVPMTHTVLMPLIIEKFPYLSKPGYVQKWYAFNLLELSQYVPNLRPQILELIIENMTKIDVQCPRKLLDCLDDEDDEVIFEMDADERLLKKFPAGAIRLDLLMDVMLNYVQNFCQGKGELDWEGTKKLYKELLYVFDRILLPTYASSHVQFIMFYICSFKPLLAEGFLDYLWKKAQNPNVQCVFRQAAIAYAASFLARAKYIPISTLKSVLDLMVKWVHMYIMETADSTSRADVNIHGAFYAVCQAIFYILAFRYKSLLSNKDGLAYCRTLNLQTIVTCRLNPLKYCMSIVTNTFSSIARQHQLAFCDTIIEKNKRNQLPISNGSTYMMSVNTLHSFFPFDPYLLPKSSVFIKPFYAEYEGVAIVEDDLESMEDEEEMYTDLPDSLPEASLGMDIIKSPRSADMTDFLLYGTSPGFKTKHI